MHPRNGTEARVRVLVVNDSGFIREGLCQLLDGFAGVEVAASMGHSTDLAGTARELDIDVVLIDAGLPGEACFALTRQLCKGSESAKVVILAVTPRLKDVRRALECGARGFLLQSAGITELELALHAAASGQYFLCPTIIKEIIDNYRAGGLSSAAISARLGLSVETIERHHQAIREHPEACHIDKMISEALRLGILQQDV